VKTTAGKPKVGEYLSKVPSGAVEASVSLFLKASTIVCSFINPSIPKKVKEYFNK